MWSQSVRYYQSIGDLRSPAVIFQEDLLHQIRDWVTTGANVVIAMDANQNIYTGPIATALSAAPFHMECLIKKTVGANVPNSHHRGTEAISSVLGTPGITPEHAMVYPHWYGIGDHRVFLLELSAFQVFGGEYPRIATATARRLNCRIDRIKTAIVRNWLRLRAHIKCRKKSMH
jgi:hypothetical protein